MGKIIPRGTVIAAKKSQTLTMTQDMQTTNYIAIYEGERTLVKDNHRIGKFELTGILLPAPSGALEVEVSFEVNEDFILSITVQNKRTGKSKSDEIVY